MNSARFAFAITVANLYASASLAVLTTCGIMTVPSAALAVDLDAENQIASSRRNTAQEWSVWARAGTNGHLLQYKDGLDTWTDLGGSIKGGAGPAATSFLPSGTTYDERACYVNTSGDLVMVNPKYGNSFTVPHPAKITFGGAVAAAVHKIGSTTRIWCFAMGTYSVDGSGRLYGLDVDASNSTCTNSCALGLLESNVDPAQPISASNSPDLATIRVYATKSDRVWMEQNTGVGGFVGDYVDDTDGDVSGVARCGTMSAAEGDLDASSYRVYVFCTKKGAANTYLYIGSATAKNVGKSAANDWDFTWLARGLPAGEGNVKNTAYAIAGLARKSGSYYTFDGFILSTTTPYKIWHTERTGGTFTSFVAGGDLGVDGESATIWGGLAASDIFGQYGFPPVVYYHGRQNGSTANDRLYSRRADTAFPSSSDPANWRNSMSGDPLHVAVQGGNPHAESCGAMAGGYSAMVAQTIVPAGGGDADGSQVIDLLWSSTNGDTWSAPTTISTACTGGGTFGRLSDPTVDLTDDGLAFICLMGLCDACLSGSNCGSCGNTPAAEYYVFDGTTLTSLGQLPVINSGHEHPWLQVERIPGLGNDILHFATLDNDGIPYDGQFGGDDIVYMTRPEIGALTSIVAYSPVPGNPNFPSSGGPMITLGAGSKEYIAWAYDYDDGGGPDSADVVICQLDATGVCTGIQPLSMIDGGLRYDREGLFGQDGPAPTKFSAGHGFDVAASPTTEGKVYYVWNAREGDGDNVDPTETDTIDERDVWFSVLTYSGGTWTRSDPVHITPNSGTDQFQPEVTVHNRGNSSTSDIIFLSWYDRRDSCGGVVNDCFRTRRAWSADGVTFVNDQITDSVVSDPQNLPVRCNDIGSNRFLGDYHTMHGDRLHSSHIFSTIRSGVEGLGMAGVSRGYEYWQP